MICIYIFFVDEGRIEQPDGDNWSAIVKATYEVVDHEMGSTAFDGTLAKTLGVSGTFRVFEMSTINE